MRSYFGSVLRRYGLVPACLAVAFLLRWLVLHGEMPFLLAWPGVMVCAWFGGLGPGLCATVLFTIVTACLTFEPPHWFAFAQPADWFGVALFVLLGSALSGLCEMLRRAQGQIERFSQIVVNQREWFRVTLTSIADGVIATDCRGRVVFMNAIAQCLTGWKEEEAKGRPVEDVFRIIGEHSRQPVVNPAYEVLRTGNIASLPGETLLVARTGTETPVDDSAAPIRREHGAIEGVVLVFHDVTRERHLARELRQRAEELARADEHKNEFLAMLGHELRNPLAPIRNAAEILRRQAPPEPDLRWAEAVIDRQVNHMSRLVDDLLDVSRIRRGKIRLQKETVELTEIIERAVETCRPLIEARRQELIERMPANPVWLEADPMRLAQVLTNLLTNAAKYTEERGRIWLEAEQAVDEVVLRVRDNGIGIDPAMLPRIFDLFTQAEAALGRSQGGLGIGLTLVRQLVELHGGTVSAQSDGRGTGSEFVIRLPSFSGKPVAAATKRQPVESDRGQTVQGARILIVEDEADAAESLAFLLRKSGYEVCTASDGPSALATAAQFRPQIVLLDLGLPGMDGYEVAQRLRQDHTGRLLVVAMTGFAPEEDRSRTSTAGFDQHLMKPIDLAALHTLLAQAEVAAG